MNTRTRLTRHHRTGPAPSRTEWRGFRRTRGAALLLSALVVFAGCGTQDKPPSVTDDPAAVVNGGNSDGLNGTLVTDPPLRVAPVTLRDTSGQPVNLADMPSDKATVLFFGFTNCDDVCPTTMADLTAARRLLPDSLAHKVTIRFVTVDPARDTPQVLRRWLNQFGGGIAGLRGPTTQVNTAERSLYADQSSTSAPTPTASSPPASSPTASGHEDHGDAHGDGHGDDTGDSQHDQVSHSGSVYIFGPRQQTVLYTGGTTPRQYAADLTRLLTTK